MNVVRVLFYKMTIRGRKPVDLKGKYEGGHGINIWSGRRDSNSRHPAPKAGALPDCATPRTV